jgi:hypothetical protein
MRKAAGSILMALIVAQVFFSGCGQQAAVTTTSTSASTTSTTTTTYANYFPLVAGQVITYEVATHLESLNPVTHLTDVTDLTSIKTYHYVGLVPFTASLEVFQIDFIEEGSIESDYYREDSSGLYFYGSSSQPTTEVKTLLKYPLTVGSSWESATPFGPGEVVAEETVETAVGTFDSLKISYQFIPGGWNYIWYAKDIGVIKIYYGYAGVGTQLTSTEIISKNF